MTAFHPSGLPEWVSPAFAAAACLAATMGRLLDWSFTLRAMLAVVLLETTAATECPPLVVSRLRQLAAALAALLPECLGVHNSSF